MTALLLFVLVLGFLAIGVPIAVSLGLSSLIILMAFSTDSIASIAGKLFESMEHYTLLAIPFFILSSAFMSTGGVAKRIIRFAIAVVGHMRGGLAIAGVFACMLFAALSGSSPATVVAIGSIVIAGMRQVGYTKEFAAGVICNAGTLGILIPPSIVMVVYAAATDVSVGRMFLAGVIPGLIAGGMLMVGIYVAARVKNLPAEEWRGWSEVISSAMDAFWGLMLIVIILGGIYGGVFTPTEAAAVASIYAFLVAVFVYRDMGPLKDKPWCSETDHPAEWNMFKLPLRLIAFPIAAVLVYMAVLLALFVLGLMVERVGMADKNAFAFVFQSGVSSISVIPVWIPVVGLLYAPIRTFMKHLVVSNDGAHVGFFAALYGGLRIWARNLFQIVVYFVPSMVHSETKKTLLEAGRLTIMLMFIIANALILKHVLTTEQVPQAIAQSMLDFGFSWWTFLIAVNVLLLIGGQFMEPSGLIVIVAPLVFPIAIELGVDPIHLGIIMVVNMEIGMITPPVGLNLFVTSGVAGMPVMSVVRAAMPWLGILAVFLVLVTYVPWISTFLPTSLMGPEVITH